MKKRSKAVALPPFENGQVWQMGDTSLRIGLVGKTLVHYKHYSAVAKRPPVQLSGKWVLEQFLQKNEAILLPEAPQPAPGKQGVKPRARTRKKPAAMSKPQPAGAD